MLGQNEIEEILYNKEVIVKKIYSNNSSTGWQIQEENEIVVILQGSAILEYEDKEIKLETNSVEYIGKYKKHRVKETSSDCIWLCVYEKN